MNDGNSKSNNKNEEQRPVVIRNTTDLQRLKLEKLMKNPDKPVVIPEKPKGRSMPSVPDFVRNVMGSSAGAGSGEFHVYRHLRRKEYARQKFIQEKSERERLNDDYHQKLDDNRKAAEDKTAKKRAKRQKKKLKAKDRAKKPKSEKPPSSSSESDPTDSESEDKIQKDDLDKKDNECNDNNSNKAEMEINLETENSNDNSTTNTSDNNKNKSSEDISVTEVCKKQDPEKNEDNGE